MPGTRHSSATRGLTATLRRLSSRLLPGRSGSSSRSGPSTRMKPGSPPRGVRSGSPSGEAVDRMASGHISMNARQISSSWVISLVTARPEGLG